MRRSVPLGASVWGRFGLVHSLLVRLSLWLLLWLSLWLFKLLSILLFGALSVVLSSGPLVGFPLRSRTGRAYQADNDYQTNQTVDLCWSLCERLELASGLEIRVFASLAPLQTHHLGAAIGLKRREKIDELTTLQESLD